MSMSDIADMKADVDAHLCLFPASGFLLAVLFSCFVAKKQFSSFKNP
jgi:hypothetical protein